MDDFRVVRVRMERDCVFLDAPVSIDVFRFHRFVRESDFSTNQRERGVQIRRGPRVRFFSFQRRSQNGTCPNRVHNKKTKNVKKRTKTGQ